jgi:hypothetical protein
MLIVVALEIADFIRGAYRKYLARARYAGAARRRRAARRPLA